MATQLNITTGPVLLTDAKVAAIKAPAAGREEHRDLKVTGLRLRVGSSGKKTWIVRARVGDTVVNRKIGAYPGMGLASARTAAEEVLKSLSETGSVEALDRTFDQVAEAWIEKVAKVRNKSWEAQERRLKKDILPVWSGRRVKDIRRSDVRDLIDGIEGEVLPNRVLALVRPIFRYALARDWIDASPAEGIEKPKAETPRDRVLSMDEIVRIWRAADLVGHPSGPYARILLLTGQRRSEVAAMRWDSLDLDAGIWTLQGAETKSKRAHLVPLSAPTVAILKALPRFGQFVFSTNGETHISGFGKMKQKFDAFIAADGGEPMKGWRFHDLRRAFATHAVRLGVLPEVVGKVLNHAAQGVTAKVYALHQYEPEKRSALDRWAAEVERAVTGTAGSNVVKLRPGK